MKPVATQSGWTVAKRETKKKRRGEGAAMHQKCGYTLFKKIITTKQYGAYTTWKITRR